MTNPRKPVAIGFDIEGASADRLYAETHDGGPYVRLIGAQGDGGPVIESDPGEIVPALQAADHIYGHNIFRFDIPALARHAGADYDTLAAKAWDTAILERLVDPPGAKHARPAGYYGLDQVAHRYGHEGKTDDLLGLALRWGPRIGCEGCEPLRGDTEHPRHAEGCTRRRWRTELSSGRIVPGKMTKAERIDIGFERIPVDDPEYRDYLVGDLAATQHVQRSVFQRVTNWDYARREMKVAAIQNRMTFNGWRVNRETLARCVRQEDERRRAAIEILCDDYGVPRTRADGGLSASPWATDGGREALVAAFREAGAEHVPRTKSGALAIGKEAMGGGAHGSEGWWVNHEGRRVPTMPFAYADKPRVLELVDVLRQATGASMKYAEIAKYVTAEGRVHGGIGEDQASGRWAMTNPSLTNLGKRGVKVAERAPFVPEPGHVLLTCDASQVDMRAIAGLCQDPGYMALFAPGRDAHMEMAQVYFGERTEDARDKTKAINHKINYGGSAASTSVMNGIPLDVVNGALSERRSAYPGLISWGEENIRQGAAGQLLDNGFGRMMRCDPDRAGTQASALKGQGAARDLICEALLRLVAANPHVTPYLRGVVHDEVVLSVPAVEVDYWTEALVAAFTFTWRDVPILCELGKPGENWADCYRKAA